MQTDEFEGLLSLGGFMQPVVSHSWNLNVVLVFYNFIYTILYGPQSSRQGLRPYVIVAACICELEYIWALYMVAGVVWFLHN